MTPHHASLTRSERSRFANAARPRVLQSIAGWPTSELRSGNLHSVLHTPWHLLGQHGFPRHVQLVPQIPLRPRSSSRSPPASPTPTAEHGIRSPLHQHIPPPLSYLRRKAKEKKRQTLVLGPLWCCSSNQRDTIVRIWRIPVGLPRGAFHPPVSSRATAFSQLRTSSTPPQRPHHTSSPEDVPGVA